MFWGSEEDERRKHQEEERKRNEEARRKRIDEMNAKRKREVNDRERVKREKVKKLEKQKKTKERREANDAYMQQLMDEMVGSKKNNTDADDGSKMSFSLSILGDSMSGGGVGSGKFFAPPGMVNPGLSTEAAEDRSGSQKGDKESSPPVNVKLFRPF